MFLLLLLAGDILADHKWADEDLLGMDHIDKRRVVGEKGVFIRASSLSLPPFPLSSRDTYPSFLFAG